MPALRALQDVPTQGRRAAPCQIVKGSPLLGREPLAVPFQEFVVTASDHLGHFGLRSDDHGLGSSPGDRSRSSSGLRIDLRAAVETWR